MGVVLRSWPFTCQELQRTLRRFQPRLLLAPLLHHRYYSPYVYSFGGVLQGELGTTVNNTDVGGGDLEAG